MRLDHPPSPPCRAFRGLRGACVTCWANAAPRPVRTAQCRLWHAPGANDLRVASWNLHKCVGADRRFDPDRSAAVIAELGADIVALQEADKRFGRRDRLAGPGGHRTCLRLGAAARLGPAGRPWLAWQCVAGPSRHRGAGSPPPPAGCRAARRRGGGTRPAHRPAAGDRGAFRPAATAAGPARRGPSSKPSPPARRCRRCCSATSTNGIPARSPPCARWSRCSARTHLRRPAFRRALPVLALDRILGLPQGLVTDVVAHDSPLARIASDHLPLTAWVQLDRAEQALPRAA